MAKLGESIVVEYLRDLGLIPIKINVGTERTPDFEVTNKDGELLFYLEEKTIEADNFLDNVETGVIIEGNDPSENTLEKKFRIAVKQFNQVNESHSVPNVIAFVNFNNMVNIHDLHITLTGHGITEDGEFISLRRAGRVVNDIEHVDLCLWFEKDELKNKFWMNNCEEREELLKVLLQV